MSVQNIPPQLCSVFCPVGAQQYQHQRKLRTLISSSDQPSSSQVLFPFCEAPTDVLCPRSLHPLQICLKADA